MLSGSLRRTASRCIQCRIQRQQAVHIHNVFRQQFRLPLRNSRRPAFTPNTIVRSASTADVLKQTFRENPVSVSVATIFILIGIGALLYTNHFYHTYILGAFSRYPEPVAVKMRRALYYTNLALDPQLALKYYKQALQVAEEIGMDPFSDEVIGIKLQLALFFENIERVDLAINVLEVVRKDCIRWVEDYGESHYTDGQRAKVLGKAVQLSIKLGELYSSAWIWDQAAAEERLVWGVETTLREMRRREQDGIKEGEGEWLDSDQIGAALESLGTHFEKKGHFSYAAPLFLQALALSPPKHCHRVVLMNNLATSLAQQGSPKAPQQDSSPPIEITQPVSLDLPSSVTLHPAKQATLWAEQALELAATIKPPDRTEECDLGCAVATHNLGEFAEMLGNWREAESRYREAASLAKAIGFEEGVRNADIGLKRLKSKS